ncbi:hypothetical protein QTI33_13145 [Variovorax sp. J22P271]|uniref:hypothetical protein n=1 Tax=Variovorax davisae TaxID=3053515 RepID=UPI00257638E2|nr:hypothetical protein [Variovorax sp. J22P271]MDM0033074.1 hypothetical protein [Variovorax sp. J22P271]
MVYTTRSSAAKPNPDFTAFARQPGEGNLAWGERAAVDIGQVDPDECTYLVLLGGADTLAFRVRVAQAHLRPDMLPSLWSHSLLVKLRGPSLRNAQAISVPLVQPGGPAYPPYENGVVETRLTDFDDPERFPNIAIAALPIPQSRILQRVDVFRSARSSLDGLEHVLRWLAFSWGVARTGNPLHENYGLPSACMLEIVCAAEDFELTPGLESRVSCPEAIWASLRHWHEYYEKTGDRKVPYGRYSADHWYPILEPRDRHPPAPPQGPRRRAKKPPR